MKTDDGDGVIAVEYVFRADDGGEQRFRLELDEKTMAMRPPRAEPLPKWTRLDFFKCDNCPLDPEQHRDCPVAAGMVGLVEAFKKTLSYQDAEIIVQCHGREYRKKTAVQYGVSSLMGLHMVTHGCPIMDKLRPMAYTHLPFATIKETLYRIISMYLTAQYFVAAEGGKPDWKLDHLGDLYEQVGVVNRCFHRRLANITGSSDAINNALVNLDCFAMLTTIPNPSEHMAGVRELFAAWTNPAPPRAH